MSGIRRGARRTAALIGVAVGAAGLDQVTKAWAVAALDDGPLEVVGEAVRFRLVRNTGSAFSLFTGWAPLLAVVGVVLTVVVVRTARRESDPVAVAGLALVLGGAVGNLLDRLLRDPGVLQGAVVDFIDIGPWPTFNLADAAITAGAGLLVVRGFRSGVQPRSAGG